jgi:hypothetical protein
MTKREKDRRRRLMPRGIPRWVRCYDNGGPDMPGGSCDRYTVCFTGAAVVGRAPNYPSEHYFRAMSADPFWPQGIGLWGSNPNCACDSLNGKWPPALGRRCHLGVRIRFQDLPADCRRLIRRDYRELWNLKGKSS